ncbi:uncharacterized protein K02A2.6-like [Dermacentor silvarum]|uniref:uncharacterized protein K02A2.6-like n=1 Tax=Dermacentor silvarum TaxID=543639 RepID=UPI0018971C86|nr:uncharacterized protein K02A2.6-like [Dermacentor silvarum]
MPLYGTLEPFEGDESAWPVYEEQVHVFFRANDTPEAKQRDIFQCQFSQAQCITCGKTGHLARVCRGGRTNSGQQQQPGSSPGSTQARGQGSRRKRSRRGRAAAGAGPSAARLHVVAENPPIFDMWHTGLVPSSVPPYLLTVEVCGHPISLELDTGASVSVMAGKLLKRTFPDVSVEASGVMLRSYCGQLAQVQGQAQVSVRFGEREATLPLYLTKRSSPTLLGHYWIHALGVRLPAYQEAILHVVKDVPSLLTDFKSLFRPGVGTFAGTTASIYVPEEARPYFFKLRPLPFALKDGVTQELQRLQREGILVPVKTSDWAAPIVPVLKRDGSVKICGDFKVTINPVATVEKYPLPWIEDLWSALSGGQKFTELDLKDTYQQLVLQDASRKGMRHVVVYLDDILVTGTYDGDHLQNLHYVLARLQDAGLRLKLEKGDFLAPSVEYLGHVISQAGLSLASRKVDAVLKAPKPHNKELQR